MERLGVSSLKKPALNAETCGLSREEMRRGVFLTWCWKCHSTTKHRETGVFHNPLYVRVLGCVKMIYSRQVSVCLDCGSEYLVFRRLDWNPRETRK